MDCWSSFNSATTANTFETIFYNYDTNCMASLYLREDIPSSKKCKYFFSISENAVIKSIFKRTHKTGFLHKSENICVSNELIQDINETKNRYKKYSKKRNIILLLIRELLWKLGKWKSQELVDFLDSYNPDIVVIEGVEKEGLGLAIMNRLIRACEHNYIEI